MDKIVERVKQVAVGVLNAAIFGSPENGRFKALIAFDTPDGEKPLYLAASTHGDIEDGHCMAILNPDEALMGEVKAGVGYTDSGLKEIVAGRCDVALDVWSLAYKENGVEVTMKYKARTFQPAKFRVA